LYTCHNQKRGEIDLQPTRLCLAQLGSTVAGAAASWSGGVKQLLFPHSPPIPHRTTATTAQQPVEYNLDGDLSG
jgi:hypothetical protein